MLGLNTEILDEFYSTNGLEKLVNYNLNGDSKILELGGYDGTWISKMIRRYDPNVYVIEPIKEFYEDMKNRHSENPKFTILNIGASNRSYEGVIYLNGDSTSSYTQNSNERPASFRKMEEIIESFSVKSFDLVQINIEGEEYKLLEDMIESGTIGKFENIQIQFHTGIDNYIERRDKIQEGLIKNGFSKSFDYPFVWEGWTKNKQ